MQRKQVEILKPDLQVSAVVEWSDAVAPYVAGIISIKVLLLGRWLDITNKVVLDADAGRAMQSEIVKEFKRGN